MKFYSKIYVTMKIYLAWLIILLLQSSCIFSQIEHKNYDKSLGSLLRSSGINQEQITLLIDKSDFQLCLMADTILIKAYPIVLGGNPVDDKLRQGDQCTPEGTFYIVSKYPHKSWSKFIWINYPTADSWRKHKKAKQNGLIPKDANIGGEIGIHGVPEGLDKLIDLKQNWTLGCISLRNKDINEIYPYIEENTKIVIRK
jgi:murein L,D-transpeptidase YafK